MLLPVFLSSLTQVQFVRNVVRHNGIGAVYQTAQHVRRRDPQLREESTRQEPESWAHWRKPGTRRQRGQNYPPAGTPEWAEAPDARIGDGNFDEPVNDLVFKPDVRDTLPSQ